MKSSTPFSTERPQEPGLVRWRGRWRPIAGYLGLILLVESALAYLVSWVVPPVQPCLVSLACTEYAAPSLAALVRSTEPAFANLSVDLIRSGGTRQDILHTLDALAKRSARQPVLLYVQAVTLMAGEGEIYLLPSDATPDEAWTWLRLRDVLVKLQACPSRQKLLVLDLTPAASARLGNLSRDVAAALPRLLKAVPDEARCVLCSHAAGQSAHVCQELGQSIFAYYVQQGLLGRADGCDGPRDGHISSRELAAFVQQRVERWSRHNRVDRQTPLFYGISSDVPLLAVAPPSMRVAEEKRDVIEYPAWLRAAWEARDAVYRSGQCRLAPRLFQRQQASLYAAEQAWRTGMDETRLRKEWLPDCERAEETFLRLAKEFPSVTVPEGVGEAVKKSFAAAWRQINNGTDLSELRSQYSPAELDKLVFAQARQDGPLEPGTLRRYDDLLHPGGQTPRSGETLRLRQLADLALRVEVFAWPRELVAMVLKTTEIGEEALRQTPHFSGYTALLEEPAQQWHAGEIRLWARGFANLDEAKQLLQQTQAQFARLRKLNEQWQQHQKTLASAYAELPGYVRPLEALPTLRESWQKAAGAAQKLAEVVENPAPASIPKESWDTRMSRLEQQQEQAANFSATLLPPLQKLRAPFTHAEVVRAAQHCRAPQADAVTLQQAETLLSMSGPALGAAEREMLWQSAHQLAHRLHGESRVLDCLEKPTPAAAENKTASVEPEARRALWRAEAQLALAALAGIDEECLRPLHQELERCKQEPMQNVAWCELGTHLQRLLGVQWPNEVRRAKQGAGRERRMSLLPPLDRFAGIDDREPTFAVQQRREQIAQHERWLQQRRRYLASAYEGLNLDCAGVKAAHGFYAHGAASDAREASFQLNVAAPLEPLTKSQPYAHGWLEVTRVLPAGAFGTVELHFHRPDETWLKVSPDAATLPADPGLKTQRKLVHKVPLKVLRQPSAERSGLPTPAGFLVEARFEGKLYHHLVATPLPPDANDVQILVSAQAQGPESPESEIRVRPGNAKQPHYFFLKNLTNRRRQVQVDIAAGETLLHRSKQTLGPDEIRALRFATEKPLKRMELSGPIRVQVLDEERQKVLAEKFVRVSILPPQEYVKAGEASYEPGGEGNNQWRVQVQSSRLVAGPAIAAELVLPARRIPGLVGIGGGTLQVELPTLLKSSRLLFAEKIQLANDVEQEGPVYLNIDGVARAFVYRTTFARTGVTQRADRDDRPAVRLVAPTTIMAGIQYLVDVEVDNAPPGSRLEVALGRINEGVTFKTEMVREFAEAKKNRISMETANDALVFEASIQDWTTTFDTRALAGTRELRARLLDADGKEYAWTSQPVVIDNTPPLARLLPLPEQVKAGTLLQVQAHGADPESGLAQVVFFLGQPVKGDIPLGATKIKGVPADQNFTQWATSLQIPADQRGALPISVYVVNRAGMASVATATVQVVEREPDKTGLGQMQGRVVEGSRPQPNLTVTLLDEQGKEIAQARTQPDGSFAFGRLAPGRYRLRCIKPESQRRAEQGVLIEPDRIARVDLSLSL